MLRSPALRIDACNTGGGAMTPPAGAANEEREETPPTSGAGATTEACGNPDRRDVPWPISGGGATIDPGPVDKVSCDRRMPESGAGGGTRFEATIFGRAEPGNLMLGSLRSGAFMPPAARSGATLMVFWAAVWPAF